MSGSSAHPTPTTDEAEDKFLGKIARDVKAADAVKDGDRVVSGTVKGLEEKGGK